MANTANRLLVLQIISYKHTEIYGGLICLTFGTNSIATVTRAALTNFFTRVLFEKLYEYSSAHLKPEARDEIGQRMPGNFI